MGTCTRHIHIAILDTDVPVPAVYAARGLYSSQFRILLQSAATRLNRTVEEEERSNTVPPRKQRIKIHTSAYDVVGGSYPSWGMLRKTANLPTPRRENEYKDDNDDDDNIFRPIDALLITGSAAAAYYEGGQYAWITELKKFIQRVWTQYPQVKMFGSCFGHQIIAQALLVDETGNGSKEANEIGRDNDNGSPLVRVEACPLGYEMGIQPITLSPEFTDTPLGRVFAEGLGLGLGRQAGNDDGKLHIQLIHGDRVIGFRDSSTTEATAGNLTALPSPWLNLGSTQLSPIQGLYHPGRVLTYQGHFEFDLFVNTESVLEFGRRASWDKPVVDEYLRQVNVLNGSDDDSKLAAEIVVRFFVESTSQSRQDVQDVLQMDTKVEKEEEEELVRSVTKNGLATPPDETSIHL